MCCLNPPPLLHVHPGCPCPTNETENGSRRTGSPLTAEITWQRRRSPTHFTRLKSCAVFPAQECIYRTWPTWSSRGVSGGRRSPQVQGCRISAQETDGASRLHRNVLRLRAPPLPDLPTITAIRPTTCFIFFRSCSSMGIDTGEKH